MGSRTNTTAQSEAAEVRTVAELLSLGLVAGQYPRNFPAADVYAFAPEVGRIVPVQVKYTHAADTSDFWVREESLSGCEFVVTMRANASRQVAGRTAMQIWVCPTSELVPRLQRNKQGTYIRFSQLRDEWLFAWKLIAENARTASS
jgi:hypothetical protein